HATVKAKRVTSKPAWGMLKARSRAIPGSRPTMMNSVVSTVKPAADKSRMGSIRTPESHQRDQSSEWAAVRYKRRATPRSSAQNQKHRWQLRNCRDHPHESDRHFKA